MTDVTQGIAAEYFLESLLPRLYFMRFSPPEVTAGEIQLWTGKTNEGPAGDTGLPRPTQALRLALIEQLFLEGRAEIDSHDAVDMLHALVPASYCQFVLLDGRWCDLVERARRRLSRAGITGVANVYSERRDGISEFLAALQAYSHA